MKHQSSRPFVWAIPILLFAFGRDGAVGGESPPSAAGSRPNILVILADDMGYHDLGVQGSPDFALITPTIDGLARGGARFASGYVTGSICCPSRAGFMTGRHQQCIGFETNVANFPRAGLPAGTQTLAHALRAAGYRTYAVGKWHLGGESYQYPTTMGFDEFFGFIGGARSYFAIANPNSDNRLQRNGVTAPEDPNTYLTDRWGLEATAYIQQHVAQHPDQPFFLYLAFNAVHAPLEADPARLADPRVAAIADPGRRTLGAMTLALDQNVDRVLQKLAALGIAEKTLVVFFNDNGGPEDEVSGAPNHSNNDPLRGHKQDLYEGGIRVPFLIRWPSVIAAGRVVPDPVISLDLMPTFLAAAGGALLPGQSADGVNLLPLLEGRLAALPERCLFWRDGGSTAGESAIRRGPWKLHRADAVGGGAAELYNLDTDIAESTNLAGSRPDLVESLTAAYDAWEAGVIEPLWGGGAPLCGSGVTVGYSHLGYAVAKGTAGVGAMLTARRYPLSTAQSWAVDFSLEVPAGSSPVPNGYLALGESTDATKLILLGFRDRTLQIIEQKTGRSASVVLPEAPAGILRGRAFYQAASRSLSIDLGGGLVTLGLTGTYGPLIYNGYAVEQGTLYASPPASRAPSASAPSSFTGIQTRRDYPCGTWDAAGKFMGGTEVLSLVSHKGKLYAGNGYWNDAPGTDPSPGAQVLVKDGPAAPWRVELNLGVAYLRLEALKSVTITTDKTGAALNPPVTLLLAGSGDHLSSPTRSVCWIRNDSGTWTPTTVATVSSGTPSTRVFADHVDRSSGIPIHYVFAGIGGDDAQVVRGAYNAATRLIEWDAIPELTGTERILSAGECNGFLYACIGSNGVAGDNIGGVFYRQDGATPLWRFVYEWPYINTKHPDIRGFTAVPHPAGAGYEVALVTLEMYGQVFRIDPIGGNPANGHTVTMELDIRQYFGDAWNGGTAINYPALSAYNDMPAVTDPKSGEPLNLIGTWVNHPNRNDPVLSKSAWFLIRHRDARYEFGQVNDPAYLPPDTLRAVRASRPSPFDGDPPGTLYFGGFDGAGGPWHNTAWIYGGGAANQPPRIVAPAAAGPNPAEWTDAVLLTVAAEDPDGWPAPIAYSWSMVSGPGAVTWIGPLSPDGRAVAARFGAPGTYVLRATATDGRDAVASDVAVTVVFSERTIPLAAGYNLISLPLAPEPPLTAEGLAQQINAQGGTCTSVIAYDAATGAFVTHPAGTAISNFNIEAGQGYFVRCSAASSWRVLGARFFAPLVPLPLREGYNLVGLPVEPSMPGKYTAEGAAIELNAQSGGATQIIRYDETAGQFVTHPVGTALQNFSLDPGRGYFLRCTKDSVWTVSR